MTLPAFSQDLTLEAMVQKALDASPDLKVASKDIDISKNDISIARADYFPTVQARLNVEYLRDLENQPRPVVAVGNTIIPAGTRYQNSVGVSTSYTLIDYGTRKRQVDYSRKDVLAKTAIYDQAVRDLKLKVIDLYTDALLVYKGIQANQAILELATQGYQMKKRLHNAGTSSKVDVATEAIQVAQALDDIETQKHQLAQKLEALSYYTQEPYDASSTELADLTPENPEPSIQLDELHAPETRNYDAQIAMKQKEIEILKRKYLPQVSMYSYYNFYGFDPDNLHKAVRDLSQRTISVGLSVAMPVFDGFKTQGQIRKAELEKEKLVLQKTKALLDLKHQAKTLEQQVDMHTVLLKTKATILNKTQDKLTMEDRLSEKQLVDKTQAIQDHIERIRRQLETETTLVQGLAAMKKLRILEMGS
jgi:outer membrane protein TolC